MQPDDPELLARFRAGDEAAVRTVYRAYAGAVRTVARSLTADAALVDEIVQDTFLKAWRAADTFDQERSLAPWLYTIARRTAVDALRRERRPTMGDHAPETDVAVASISFESTWEAFELRKALDALPGDEREVVRLSHLIGLTHPQIATRLDLPLGTVKSRSARAMRRLYRALAHLGADENQPSDRHRREERTNG